VLVDGASLEGPEPEEVARGTLAPGGSTGRGRPDGASVAALGDGLGADRDLDGVRRLLRSSALAAPVRERSERLFARLTEVLSRSAGSGPSGVHEVRFTGLPGIDFLVDLVGSAAAVEHLAPARITCAAVNVGGAAVPEDEASGGLPVSGPGAGSLWLLEGAPVYAGGPGERLTPTGAVLLAELVDSFEPRPAMVADRVGCGLGRFDTPDRPNVLRVHYGRLPSGSSPVRGTNPRSGRVPSGGGETG
jgi:uncharacterized protein (DUF111 family)